MMTSYLEKENRSNAFIQATMKQMGEIIIKAATDMEDRFEKKYSGFTTTLAESVTALKDVSTMVQNVALMMSAGYQSHNGYSTPGMSGYHNVHFRHPAGNQTEAVSSVSSVRDHGFRNREEDRYCRAHEVSYEYDSN